MFNLKDNVVYPGLGVAVIEQIIEKKVSGIGIKFFKLSFLFKDMTILLPVNNAKGSGVRHPENKKEVERVFNFLADVSEKSMPVLDFTPSGWNRRNKEYQLKIQGGKLIEISEIFKDLMYVSQQKELSFGEKSLLQTAEDLLIQEIQLITNESTKSILDKLRLPFKKFFFHQTPTEHITSSTV